MRCGAGLYHCDQIRTVFIFLFVGRNAVWVFCVAHNPSRKFTAFVEMERRELDGNETDTHPLGHSQRGDVRLYLFL